MPYHMYDYEVVVDPLIFDLRLTSPSPFIINSSAKQIQSNADKFEERMNIAIKECGANSYTYHNFYKTFGFQNLTREESIKQAQSIQKIMSSYYPDDFEVDLGFSTLGLKKYEDIHKNILDYINTSDFNEVISSYVRFLNISEYRAWMEG